MKNSTTFVMVIHTKTKTHFPLGYKYFLVTIPKCSSSIAENAEVAFKKICKHENLKEEDMPILGEYYSYGNQDFEVIDFCK